jgi:hypothetical protein
LRELGYTKKTEILSKMELSSTTVSGEAIYETAKYWSNKADVTTLFVTDPTKELILSGNIPANTTSVSINGYTLREFTPGNTTFAYKVTTASGTLIEGRNTYVLTLGQSE